MKIVSSFIALFTLTFFTACNPQPVEEEEVLASLEGSWRLVSYKQEGDTTWKQYPSTVIYEKHLSPTHFVWVRYETNNDSLVGTGGGPYVYDPVERTYTEDIQFFLPAGSGLKGQTIPFDVAYKDGKWYHTGYSKILEFDPEIGENKVVDSSKIEEIWERIDINPSDSSLVGTWQLESFKGDGDSIRSDYPEFVNYVKIITPTHFVWVHYIGEQDLVLAEGGGPYVFDGTTYTETLNFVYPSGSNQVGTVLPFECKLDNNTWYHTGYIQRIGRDDSGAILSKDSARIDEIWVPVGYQN